MLNSLKKNISQKIKSSKILASLESKNYRHFFLGQSISLIGSWMQSIALSWLIYRLTGSKFLLGFVGFTSQIPSFVISPFAGVMTDRYSRQKIMLWTQILFMLQALFLGFLSLTGLIEIWQIVALSLMFGIISAFDAPARQSLVIDLIDNPANLGNAIALNSAMFNGARLIGPAIAGMVIAIVGEGICFLFNALSYISIIIALNKIIIVKRHKSPNSVSLRKQFSEGFNYTFGIRQIRILLTLLAVISLLGIPFITLMPAYASESLKGGSHTYGFLMSTTGAGALLGAIYLASRKTVKGLEKIITLTSLSLGISIIGLSISTNLILSMAIGFISGFSMIATIASINTLIQTLAEEDMRGRVMSFYAMSLMGITPIGSLLAGTIASVLNLSWTLVIAGISTILIGLWFTFKWPVNLKLSSEELVEI